MIQTVLVIRPRAHRDTQSILYIDRFERIRVSPLCFHSSAQVHFVHLQPAPLRYITCDIPRPLCYRIHLRGQPCSFYLSVWRLTFLLVLTALSITRIHLSFRCPSRSAARHAKSISSFESEEGEDMRMLPREGTHIFRWGCIDLWLSSSCPFCRQG